MVIDFASAKAKLRTAAAKKLTNDLLRVTFDATGKLSVTLGKDAAARFDKEFGNRQRIEDSRSREDRELELIRQLNQEAERTGQKPANSHTSQQ